MIEYIEWELKQTRRRIIDKIKENISLYLNLFHIGIDITTYKCFELKILEIWNGKFSWNLFFLRISNYNIYCSIASIKILNIEFRRINVHK